MIYLDTGILVRALLEDHPRNSECFPLLSNDAVSSCHSLAETFNTLTGFFKVANDQATDLIQRLANQMTFLPISKTDYLTIISQSKARGIQGGIIYDALHAHIARVAKVKSLYTYNITNFQHVAPDLIISPPPTSAPKSHLPNPGAQ